MKPELGNYYKDLLKVETLPKIKSQAKEFNFKPS